jgi:hypothetical protein
MAGEYPPTNSSADADQVPHANPTSLSVSKHIGNWRHDWIDIVPYAPVDTPSGLVDRVALNAGLLADRAIQSNWIARIACRVDECGTWSAAGMAQQVECSARSASRALCGFKNFRCGTCDGSGFFYELNLYHDEASGTSAVSLCTSSHHQSTRTGSEFVRNAAAIDMQRGVDKGDHWK